MPELKGLLQLVFPLVLLAALALFRVYFRKSFGGWTRKAPGVPAAKPTPERVRPGPRPEPVPTGESWQRPQRPETPRRRGRSAALALGGSAADCDFPARSPGRHLRRLLADPGGRPVVILAREVLHKPVGCWWDEGGR